MTPERYQQITQLYHSALEIEPGQRVEFLDQACKGDKDLQRDVLRLLSGNERAGDFLNSPAVVVAAEFLKEEIEPMVGKQLGRFQILSMLGAGGMGEVYLAQDAQLGRQVALKLLPAGLTAKADLLRRFEREARAASSLNHPNIITIHDIGEVEGLHFIATEFIEGETIRHRIGRGRMELSEAIDITVQVANALATAHAAGIVHRDIKPENIMLRPDGYVKVLDFGLAKLTETHEAKPSADSGVATLSISNETTAGTILGTVNYMSPEQARGLKVDARTDIWSLGVTFYEMLTGKSPFAGQTMADVLVSIVDREPQLLSQLYRHLPDELDRVVMKALAKDRDERYQSAKEMAADLKNLQRGIESKTSPQHEQENTIELPPTLILTPSSPASLDEKIATVQRHAVKRSSIAIAALLVIITGLVAWMMFRPSPVAPNTIPAPISTPAPELEISYRLSVQKMNNGKEAGPPSDALEREIFLSSDRFRFHFSSPQDGHAYLLNENTEASVDKGYTLLFPTPSINNGSSRFAGNQSFQTGRYLFDPNKKTDTLIMIWAARPVEELEAVKGVVNEKELGRITNRTQLAAIRDFLNRYAQSTAEAVVDESSRQTTLKGRGEAIIHFLRLTHK
jgi:serine/threonine protein kinase